MCGKFFRSLLGETDRPRADHEPTTRAAGERRVLLRACKRILRPLIKAMIAHGITLPAVLSVLKQVYVEVAVDSFRLDGKPITDSRVSMLTGVHRKDVRTVRERGVPATAPPRHERRRHRRRPLARRPRSSGRNEYVT